MNVVREMLLYQAISAIKDNCSLPIMEDLIIIKEVDEVDVVSSSGIYGLWNGERAFTSNWQLWGYASPRHARSRLLYTIILRMADARYRR